MTPSIWLLIAVGVLATAGTYMLLERSLLRIVLGLLLLGNAINLMLLAASGPAGDPPLLNRFEVSAISDPLPQALILTAIVIAFASTAFLLSLGYRSWQLTGSDEVVDDDEDRRVSARTPHRGDDTGALTPVPRAEPGGDQQ